MGSRMESFSGYHSEWNLGSPGGWDYQRITQIIGKAIWQELDKIISNGIKLDFDHPLLFPIYGFVDMLLEAHRSIYGRNEGLIAVVAEEETLQDVTENINLAERLDCIDGISGALMAPHELELDNGKVSYQGRLVSIIFMDFNTDVLLKLHRKHNLGAVIQAVKEGRVVNPRGTEPINAKGTFEVITGPQKERFHREIVSRTPWTRQFYQRQTNGPRGESIADLVEWTRSNWENLVLKPERGYSGHGVRVGGIQKDVDGAIDLALKDERYIVQEKIPIPLWSEEIPVLEDNRLHLDVCQTDFRCLIGPEGLLGFLGRYGGVPTNVGSGGGVQPLAVLQSDMPIREAVDRINDKILEIDLDELIRVDKIQKKLAIEHDFTYLLGPIKIALRPRLLNVQQIEDLKVYCTKVWADCLKLEKMWLADEMGIVLSLEEQELEISRLQPWGGSPACLASDGLFNFGANTETA